MIEWIDYKAAIQIAKKYPKGPWSKEGIIWAGKQCGFAKKNKEGRWIFQKDKLIEYCVLSNKTTLEELSLSLNTTIGAIKYIMLKHNIRFHKKMGRKYLEQNNVTKIIRIYRGTHHGETNKEKT